uniref:tRNA 5-methylaminomethyl-2-thiouridine biosynthesis bifunctional protein MnmC n=1 Tax=Anthurium amnicola TaxID=1678845 RepID=A0A1D1YRM2_9ARAE
MASSLGSSLFCPIRPSKPSSFSLPRRNPRTVSPTCRTESSGRSQSPAEAGGKSKASGRGPRKRSPYGTSRRSILKKTLSQEQVVFTTPVADDPVVGIIGGGISGLVCAATLEKRGIRSTVFDTLSSSL